MNTDTNSITTPAVRALAPALGDGTAAAAVAMGNVMGEPPDLAGLRDQYLQQQLRGDRRAALQFIQAALKDGASVSAVRAHIVQAAQLEIGRLWQEDKITIAQEHMATAISQLALAHLFQEDEFHSRIHKTVLVACVPGEHHEFPARLLADALDVAGYDVRFLGADVPLEPLWRAIEAEQPDVLALSVTMLFHLPSLRETITAVRARRRKPLLIAVGGSVFGNAPELTAEVGADVGAATAEEFISLLSQRLGSAP